MSVLKRFGELRKIIFSSKVLSSHVIKRFQNIKLEKIESPKLPTGLEAKNECLKRPLSPHVGIYKMEFHMLSSLLHRTSGILLSTYFLVFGIGTMILPNDFQYYIDCIKDENFSQSLITTIKWIIAFPFVLHSVGGVRHLVWDTGLSLKSMKSVWSIAGVSMVSAFIITTALALIET